jgi:hypothetical protein
MNDETAPLIRANDSNMTWRLPSAAKVQGVMLLPGPPVALTEVAIQYSSAETQRWCELRMPFDQALHLAGILDQVRSDPRVVAVLRGAKPRA